jgi:hypothetical protein
VATTIKLSSPTVSRAPNRRHPERIAPIAFAVLAALAFAYIIHRGQGNTFFYDEWGWIEDKRNGLHPIFAADNNHLLVLQTALYQLLFHTIGLNHYWVFRTLEAGAHIALVTAVFVYARRRVGGPGALIAVVPLAFLGTGWQFVLWGAAGFGFLVSIALCIVALLVLERGDRRADAVACGLLVLALAFSDYTLAFLAGIAVELLWRKRPLTHVWVWAIPVAIYGIWWIGHHQPSTIRQNLTAAPGFALDALAGAVGGLFGLGIEWGRPLAVVALIGLGWTLWRPGGVTARRAGLVVAAGVFWILLGLGRAAIVEPTASRYVYVGVVFVLLIGAEALRGATLSTRALAVGALLALFALAGNFRAFDEGAGTLRVSSHQVASELGALQIARATAPAGLVVDPHYAPVLVAGPYFAAIDDLHSSPAYSAAQISAQPEYDRLAADTVLISAGSLRVSRAVSGAQPGATPPTVEDAILGATRANGGCITFTSRGSGAALDLTLLAGGVWVRAAAGPPVEIRARRFAAGYTGGPTITVPGGASALLRPTADRSRLAWHLRISPRQSIAACSLA